MGKKARDFCAIFAKLKIGTISPASFTMSDRHVFLSKCEGKRQVLIEHLKTSSEVPEEAKFTFDEIHQFLKDDNGDPEWVRAVMTELNTHGTFDILDK